jgi:antirestriction protein ArdC
MPTWEEVQIHAKKLIDEGIKMLRSGVHEASYLVDATAKSADLHVSLRRNRYDRYKAVHEIGKYVCDEVHCDPSKAEIRITDHINKEIVYVKALDDEARAFEEQISKLTVTKKGEKKSQAAKGQHPPRRKVSDQKK